MKKLTLLFVFLCLATFVSFSQTSCQTAAPFCSGTTYNFPATVGGNPAQVGPFYDCLFTQPNPAWYYLQIATPGPLTLTIQGSINGGPGQDVDFVCWGPFPNLTNVCNNLTAANVVDCSYSGSFTETLTIPNAQVGQFYMVCITNFANVAQNIVFNQPIIGPGDGTTNCAILCQATVANSGSVCVGGNVTLTANTNTAVTSYTWNGPGGFTSNQPNPVISPTVSGTYSLIATTSQGTCLATTNVTVGGLATPTISNVGATCQGMTFNLNATGLPTANYSWTGPNGFTSNLQNVQITNAVPAQSGIYLVTVTSGLCTQTANINVGITPMPTVTALNTGPYCTGQSINLTASGATTYTWTGPNAYSSNANIAVIPAAAIVNGGVYTLIGANGTCTNSTTNNVVVNPPPVVTISNNSPICENFPLQLNAGGGASYAWLGPNSYSSLQQNPSFAQAPFTANGVFTVVVTSAQNCVASATTSVFINSKPNPSIQIPNVCNGATLTMSAAGGNTYAWIGPNGFSAVGATPFINDVTGAASGFYTVVATAVGGCTAAAVTNVQIFPIPDIKILGTNSLCPGGVFTFLGQGGTYYKWLIPGGVVATTQGFTVSTLSNTLQSTYTLQGSDDNGCLSYAVINPFILPEPIGQVVARLSGSCTPLCTAFDFTSPSNLVSTSWNVGGLSTASNTNSASQCFNVAGVYPISVKMVNIYGCERTTTTSVESYPIPNANFSNDPDKPTITESLATFYDNTSNAKITGWYWDFTNNGIDTASSKNPSFKFPEIGDYLTSLIVTSEHGCIDSVSKVVTITDDYSIYIPNAFTPNGDGQNELFGAKGTGIKKYQLNIFDRWGELVFSSNDLAKGWDGTVKGNRIAQDGVYVWKVNVVSIFGSAKEYKGSVTLIR
jgi:gliding motility-associated-like protein